MTCYPTTFWLVLGLSEDVFWLRAQISPFGNTMSPEERGEKTKQAVTLQSCNTQALYVSPLNHGHQHSS
ncbi:hypothetical protein PBY51_000813 [Eleginops maclovinus]|uniref:Uncharacterized protein n=1 Tax=Eleginops maclovinus TaxID=56733 RepID=A0AAN8AQY9_ELEMC|nr:hypothetical protein PBY51_000813 [Eleginops maclovinus]